MGSYNIICIIKLFQGTKEMCSDNYEYYLNSFGFSSELPIRENIGFVKL